LNLKTRAASYGVAGLAVAGAVIFSGAALGFLSIQTSGLLSVLLTDPPSVPVGVTSIYITYTNVAVHPAGFSDSKWVTVAGEGTIDTMTLVNSSQTISTGSIPLLDYDELRLTISNITIKYLGSNYSATTSARDMQIPIVGGLRVSSYGISAALIDIQPTVVNLGDSTHPSFEVAAGARAIQVPSTDIGPSASVVGHKTSLQNSGWYDTFKSKASTNLTVSGLALSSNSFYISATDGGSDPLEIHSIIIAPSLKGGGEDAALGSVVRGAAFVVQEDGSLKLLAGNPGNVGILMESSGYLLPPGSTHEFIFSGTITNVFGTAVIEAGSTYYVIILGPGTLGVQTVVAS
jgi:hypothetical protein